MAPPAKFTADYEGIGAMLRSDFMESEMRRRAEKVAMRARDTAPVGDTENDPHAGRYKESFRVSSGVQHFQTSRAYGEVSNDAPEARIVEWGDSNTDAYHTLLAALAAAGD